MKRLLWLVPALLLMVRWHNWLALPSTRGYDNYAHRQVLQQIVLEHTFPLPNQGWAGYQPPLYYLTSGGLWHLLGEPDLFKVAQLVSTLASFLLLACAWRLGARLLPGHQWFVVLALASFPAELMLAAMVYNISLAACLAGLFLGVLVRAWPRTELVLWEELSLGLLAEATWMTRPDGACLCLVLAVLLGTRLLRRPRPPGRDAGLAFVVASLCIGSVCGWYFCRNMAHFGRPLVFNGDYDCMPYDASDPVSLPGFRTVSFYTGNDFSFFQDPNFPSQTPYLTGMTYASAWWAHVGFFYQSIDKRYAPWMLALGLIPTALSAWGLVWVLTCPPRRRQWAPVLATGAASLAMYLILVSGLPIFACVKPIYLYVGFLPWALLVGAGVAAATERWPRSLPWLTGAYALFGLFVGYVFWCR